MAIADFISKNIFDPVEALIGAVQTPKGMQGKKTPGKGKASTAAGPRPNPAKITSTPSQGMAPGAKDPKIGGGGKYYDSGSDTWSYVNPQGRVKAGVKAPHEHERVYTQSGRMPERNVADNPWLRAMALQTGMTPGQWAPPVAPTPIGAPGVKPVGTPIDGDTGNNVIRPSTDPYHGTMKQEWDTDGLWKESDGRGGSAAKRVMSSIPFSFDAPPSQEDSWFYQNVDPFVQSFNPFNRDEFDALSALGMVPATGAPVKVGQAIRGAGPTIRNAWRARPWHRSLGAPLPTNPKFHMNPVGHRTPAPWTAPYSRPGLPAGPRPGQQMSLMDEHGKANMDAIMLALGLGGMGATGYGLGRLSKQGE